MRHLHNKWNAVPSPVVNMHHRHGVCWCQRAFGDCWIVFITLIPLVICHVLPYHHVGSLDRGH